MYLTAHFVTSTDRLDGGINAYLHLHKGAFPDGTVDDALVARVAEQIPGELVKRDTDLKPGGNDVRSFVDVVAPDDVDPTEVREAIEAFNRLLPVQSLPVTTCIGGRVGIRFNANFGVWPDMSAEFAQLQGKILRLLDSLSADGSGTREAK